MSENTLEKLKQKARERVLEKKVEAFRKEQVERKRMKQVRLTRAIYAKSLASCALTIEEIIIFE
jgi:hypothetical protein